jgi:hypothetical protein
MTATLEPQIRFDPLRSLPGELRVALCLTDLEEKSLDILNLADSLGFESPQFVSDASGKVWVIILQQFHSYEDDPQIVVNAWDDQMRQIWEACEPRAHMKLLITSNFKACRVTAA